MLREEGFKEITLLGQNVNSYFDGEAEGSSHENTPGFKEMYKLRGGQGSWFADLLDQISMIAPEIWIRFTSPHPKDFPDAVLQIIWDRPNICS